MKAADKLNGDNLHYKNIKGHVAKARDILTTISHIEEWREFPCGEALSKGSLSDFLNTVAATTTKFNSDLESAKGIIKAMS